MFVKSREDTYTQDNISTQYLLANNPSTRARQPTHSASAPHRWTPFFNSRSLTQWSMCALSSFFKSLFSRPCFYFSSSVRLGRNVFNDHKQIFLIETAFSHIESQPRAGIPASEYLCRSAVLFQPFASIMARFVHSVPLRCRTQGKA